jgi:membrane protease subunit (stomatin/prohibitin family)
MMQQMMMNQMMQQMMNNPMGGNNQMNQMNQNNQANNQGAGEDDIMAKLAKLNKLKEAGLITQEEFDKKKAELLAQL